MRLSVTIITLNEEANIERVIRSVLGLAGEIIVVDSGSVDRTVSLAESLGARVFHRPFAGFGQQKNYASSLCQGEWILNLDADEEVSPALRASLEKVLDSPPVAGGGTPKVYGMNRLNHFCGSPIHYGGWAPDRIVRLCRSGQARWTEPHVHEELRPVGPGPEGHLAGPLLHFSFPTVKGQVLTNVHYASLGALELLKRKKRRPFLIELLIRPFVKFVECYILKMGLLDGTRGFIIAINAAHSMFMKYAFAYMGTGGGHQGKI